MSDWPIGWWKDGWPQRTSSAWHWPGRGLAFELGARAYNALQIANRPPFKKEGQLL